MPEKPSRSPHHQNYNLNAVAKYNPHLWQDHELKSIFVTRTRELNMIVKAVTQTPVDKVPQHILLTGGHGMGKSTLLHRVALEIEDNEEYRQSWLPVRFPEEQYTVNHLGELWSNILGALANALDRESGHANHESQAIDKKLHLLEKQPPDLQEREVLEFINDWCKQHQRRLLLLIDSSDLLFSNLNTGKKPNKKNALWQLRNVLQTQPHIFWLGGSYQSLSDSTYYQEAFLDFFYPIELKPFTIADMQQTMRALANTFGMGEHAAGDRAIEAINARFKNRPERLKIIHQLSRGNPRTTVILFELYTSLQPDNIRSDVERLLDMMTPLYKSRLETLAEQPRKLLAHILEYWRPVDLARLEKLSGIQKTSISPQLLRLEREGLIQKTALPHSSRRGYEVNERFFNIWYLMRNSPRRSRQRLHWLVAFMALWYSQPELAFLAAKRTIFHRQEEDNTVGDYEYSRAVAAALSQEAPERHRLEWMVFRKMRETAREKLDELFDFSNEDKTFTTANDYLSRLEALPEKLRQIPWAQNEKERDAWVNGVISSFYLELNHKENIAEASASLTGARYKELILIFQKEREFLIKEIGENAAKQYLEFIGKGDFFPDTPNSEIAYQQIATCFEGNPSVYRFALGLMAAQCHDEWTEKAFRHYLAQNPKDTSPWNGLGNLLQYHLGRYDEAETAYREAIRLDSKLAYPWNGLGNLLQYHLGRYDEAETAYREAIRLDSKYALPWNSLGNLLQDHLGRYDEAETAYREAIRLDSKYAHPWNNLGNLLQNHLGRYDEAETAYREAIRLDSKDAYPWNGLGNLLQDHLSRYDEAETAYREAIRLDSKYAYPWYGLGDLLQNHLGRYDEAEAAYRQANNLAPQDPYPLANLARLLARQGKKSTVSQHYREALTLAKEKHPDLRLQAHLWLGNQDLARQALAALAQPATADDIYSFFRLREQVLECQQIGLGERLAQLMEEDDDYAEFLAPFSLALRASAGDRECLLGAAAEVRNLAEDILRTIEPPVPLL